MTTLSAYLDSLVIDQVATKPGRRHWLVEPRIQRTVLVCLDVAVLLVAAALAVLGRTGLPFADPVELNGTVTLATSLVGLAWMGSLAVFAGYSLRHLRAGATEYKRVTTASFAAAGAVGIVCFLLSYQYPRGLFVLWFGLGLAGLVTIRFARRRVMQGFHRRGLLQTPILWPVPTTTSTRSPLS